MKGYERLLAVLIAATLVAGVAGVLVKDTTGEPTAIDSPTPTDTFATSPTPTATVATATPTELASPSPSPSPTRTRRAEPRPTDGPPTKGSRRTPETGVGSNVLLALALLAGAALAHRARRTAI